MIKQTHPTMFNGELREDLVFIYAEDENGVRHNIINADGNECAGVLAEYPCEEEYTESETITKLP